MSSDRSSLNTVSGSRFSRVDQFPDLETESPGTPTRQKPPDGTREAPERRTPRQTTSCSEPRSASPTEGAIPGPRPSRRSSREPTRPSWSRIPAGRAVDGQQASNASLFGKGGSRIQGRRRHAAARRLFRVEVDDGPRRGGVTATSAPVCPPLQVNIVGTSTGASSEVLQVAVCRPGSDAARVTAAGPLARAGGVVYASLRHGGDDAELAGAAAKTEGCLSVDGASPPDRVATTAEVDAALRQRELFGAADYPARDIPPGRSLRRRAEPAHSPAGRSRWARRGIGVHDRSASWTILQSRSQYCGEPP